MVVILSDTVPGKANQVDGEPLEEGNPASNIHVSTEDLGTGTDEVVHEDGTEETEVRRPIPAPRGSTRERRPPEWLRNGDFISYQQQVPEWILKANYLASLNSSVPDQIKDAIVRLVVK